MVIEHNNVTLATLIEAEDYNTEFKAAHKILNLLHEIFPEMNEHQTKNLILYTYQYHPAPVSLRARLEYSSIVLTLLNNYIDNNYYIGDYEEERRLNLQQCRIAFGKRLTRYQKQMVADITYFYYMKQLEETIYDLLPKKLSLITS